MRVQLSTLINDRKRQSDWKYKLESTINLSSSMQAQHAAARSAIALLEHTLSSLESLVKQLQALYH
jgi:hypothetical protein